MFIDSNTTDIFFTADLHIGHKNVIKYCDRPFQNVEHMNEELISRWNNKVGKDAIVFVLGDISFAKNTADIINRLNGRIYLIPGNHDGSIVDDAFKTLTVTNPSKFDICSQLHEVKIRVEDENILFVLCHYAMRVWNKRHYGSIHLYGHSHGTLPDDINSLSMDVGVDTTEDYAPYHIDDILVKLYKKMDKPIDHHTGER